MPDEIGTLLERAEKIPKVIERINQSTKGLYQTLGKFGSGAMGVLTPVFVGMEAASEGPVKGIKEWRKFTLELQGAGHALKGTAASFTKDASLMNRGLTGLSKLARTFGDDIGGLNSTIKALEGSTSKLATTVRVSSQAMKVALGPVVTSILAVHEAWVQLGDRSIRDFNTMIAKSKELESSFKSMGDSFGGAGFSRRAAERFMMEGRGTRTQYFELAQRGALAGFGAQQTETFIRAAREMAREQGKTIQEALSGIVKEAYMVRIAGTGAEQRAFRERMILRGGIPRQGYGPTIWNAGQIRREEVGADLSGISGWGPFSLARRMISPTGPEGLGRKSEDWRNLPSAGQAARMFSESAGGMFFGGPLLSETRQRLTRAIPRVMGGMFADVTTSIARRFVPAGEAATIGQLQRGIYAMDAILEKQAYFKARERRDWREDATRAERQLQAHEAARLMRRTEASLPMLEASVLSKQKALEKLRDEEPEGWEEKAAQLEFSIDRQRVKITEGRTAIKAGYREHILSPKKIEALKNTIEISKRMEASQNKIQSELESKYIPKPYETLTRAFQSEAKILVDAEKELREAQAKIRAWQAKGGPKTDKEKETFHQIQLRAAAAAARLGYDPKTGEFTQPKKVERLMQAELTPIMIQQQAFGRNILGIQAETSFGMGEMTRQEMGQIKKYLSMGASGAPIAQAIAQKTQLRLQRQQAVIDRRLQPRETEAAGDAISTEVNQLSFQGQISQTDAEQIMELANSKDRMSIQEARRLLALAKSKYSTGVLAPLSLRIEGIQRATAQQTLLTRMGGLQQRGVIGEDLAGALGQYATSDREGVRQQVEKILEIKEQAYQKELQFTVSYTQARMNVISEHYQAAITREKMAITAPEARIAPFVGFGQETFGLQQIMPRAVGAAWGTQEEMLGEGRQARALRESRQALRFRMMGIQLPENIQRARMIRSQREAEEDFRRTQRRRGIMAQSQVEGFFGTIGAIEQQGVGWDQLRQTEGGRNLLIGMIQQTMPSFVRTGGGEAALGDLQGLVREQRVAAARRLQLSLRTRGMERKSLLEQIGVMEEGATTDEAKAALAGKYKEAMGFAERTGDVELYNRMQAAYQKIAEDIPVKIKQAYETEAKVTNTLLKSSLDVLKEISNVLGGGRGKRDAETRMKDREAKAKVEGAAAKTAGGMTTTSRIGGVASTASMGGTVFSPLAKKGVVGVSAASRSVGLTRKEYADTMSHIGIMEDIDLGMALESTAADLGVREDLLKMTPEQVAKEYAAGKVSEGELAALEEYYDEEEKIKKEYTGRKSEYAPGAKRTLDADLYPISTPSPGFSRRQKGEIGSMAVANAAVNTFFRSTSPGLTEADRAGAGGKVTEMSEFKDATISFADAVKRGLRIVVVDGRGEATLGGSGDGAGYY